MIEYYYMCQSDNGSIADSSPIRQWSQKYMQSQEAFKEPRAGLRLQNLLAGAGFVEVGLEMIRVPLCAWLAGEDIPPNPVRSRPSQRSTERCRASLTGVAMSDPPKQKRIGELARDSVKETMSSLSMLPFTKILKMQIEEANRLVENAVVDATTPGLKPYFSL